MQGYWEWLKTAAPPRPENGLSLAGDALVQTGVKGSAHVIGG